MAAIGDALSSFGIVIRGLPPTPARRRALTAAPEACR
jgi:hypothetical protein